MTNVSNFKPEWISPPGDTILDILQERTLDSNWLVEILNCSESLVKDLLVGKHRITDEIAEILSENLGSSSQFWLSRDNFYLSCLKERENIISLLENSIPYSKMVEYNWLPKAKDRESKLDNILDFFEVPNVIRWDKEYGTIRQDFAFRASQAFDSDPIAVAAWLKQAEHDTSQLKCDSFDSKKLFDTLPKFKKLTRQKDPEIFLPELKLLCAQVGIALSVIQPLPKCSLSGAGRINNSGNKALIAMNARHLTDDHFWFTFFHEIGHLYLHREQKLFVEFLKDKNEKAALHVEKEANDFARDALIPVEIQKDLKIIKRNKKEIIRFAARAGVSPGIIVGQLQHEKIIPQSSMNFLKRRYHWTNSRLVLG